MILHDRWIRTTGASNTDLKRKKWNVGDKHTYFYNLCWFYCSLGPWKSLTGRFSHWAVIETIIDKCDNHRRFWNVKWFCGRQNVFPFHHYSTTFAMSTDFYNVNNLMILLPVYLLATGCGLFSFPVCHFCRRVTISSHHTSWPFQAKRETFYMLGFDR